MVGKIWEDKWEYENFTYILGDPLVQEGNRDFLEIF